MSETRRLCMNCKDCPASGLWLAQADDVRPKFLALCAQCGFTRYVAERIQFTPSLHVDLIKTFGTSFVQAESMPMLGDKHWAEHPQRKTDSLSEMVIGALNRKQSKPPSISSSILDQYRRWDD